MSELDELRDGFHLNRFSPYIASLEPTHSFLKIKDTKPRVCTEIDVNALLQNITHVMEVAAEYGNETMAVIKADGYGHGAVIVARLLNKYRGINFFGIASVSEALELRAAGLTDVRILVLGPTHESEWDICAAAHIEIVLDSAMMVDLLLNWGTKILEANPSVFDNPENHLKVHVYLNTGMNRIGLCTFDSTTETHGKKNKGNTFKSVSNIFSEGPEELQSTSASSSLQNLSVTPPSISSTTSAAAKIKSIPAFPLPMSKSTQGPIKQNNRSYKSSNNWSYSSNNQDSVNSTTSNNDSTTTSLVLTEVRDTILSIARMAVEGVKVGVKFEGICTHMCDAESRSNYSMRQLNRLRQVVKGLRDLDIEIPCLHVANSEALLSRIIDHRRWRRIVGNSKSFCRIGGALYGLRRFKDLTPALTLRAQVRYVGICEEGMTVGYDRTWIAPRDCLVATLSIGFGDGYSRKFSNNGQIGIRGMLFPIAGTICMDMTMVDLGPSDGPGAQVKVGDYATMYGLGAISIADTSKHLATCQSDLCCHLSRRIARRYVNLPPEVEKDEQLFSLYGERTTQYDSYCM